MCLWRYELDGRRGEKSRTPIMSVASADGRPYGSSGWTDARIMIVMAKMMYSSM